MFLDDPATLANLYSTASRVLKGNDGVFRDRAVKIELKARTEMHGGLVIAWLVCWMRIWRLLMVQRGHEAEGLFQGFIYLLH